MQLLLLIIAAFGGVVFSNELLTERLVIASTLILGGILLALLSHKGADETFIVLKGALIHGFGDGRCW
ncbi:MAG: drug/metabolite transporter (DMT)-like permease [Chitinophagales bacterium]|jgi:drug/metabolite transporter (DMT)-like permease